MSSFLDRILEAQKQQIAASKALISPGEIERLAARRSDYRGFESALNQEGIRIIAEIKRASPSQGAINLRLSPAATAAAYEAGGAAALSVLTEPQFFKGSVRDMQEARAAVALPVLRKDFMLEPYQIYESAAAGADAVLLIVRTLDDETLHALYALSRAIGLDVLTEVFDGDDLRRAAELGATLVGINNRDLARFATDVGHAARVAAHLPHGVAVVAASGIHCADDIAVNLKHGIRRFLIGEALVRASDPASTLRSWTGGRES